MLDFRRIVAEQVTGEENRRIENSTSKQSTRFNPSSERARQPAARKLVLAVARVGLPVSTFILTVFATAKLITAASTEAILAEVDPIIGIKNRTLFYFLGFVELSLGAILVTSENLRLKASILTTAGTTFLGYHVLRNTLEVPSTCPCLGTLLHWAPMVEPYAEHLSIAAAIGFLMTGIILTAKARLAE